ncbi:sensor histidine kinase [Paraliomyxa miuraensis]|uniref:sensor histidine kinase n=1 Tax=Paraliomyxa miuraensis TaxID=376150 RepID=UPI0022508ACD|nr:sensor histidine kinase [Paraliomyxa miuraensis]MCX4246370.1 sensor histidine kinase [Paraliomyxa miuraensis]
MPVTHDGSGPRLRLRGYLGARLGPLALLLVAAVAISAPVAFYVLGTRAARVQARATAQQFAAVVRHEAEQRPLLWKYDSPKMLAHLRAYDDPRAHVEHIAVIDAMGQSIDRESDADIAALSALPIVWERAPVTVNNEDVAEVWVAASTEQVRVGALRMLAIFGLLGAALAGLMYWLPLRAMGRVEREIGTLLDQLRESRAALSTLAENLEQQVEARSSDLSRALAELKDKEQNLRELSTRAVSMQEAERRAIARELHDSAGQSLTAIRIHMQLIEGLAGQAGDNAGRLGELAVRTTTMVDETLEEIRRAVNTLGPAVLDDVGLGEAIERACLDLAERLEIEVDCDVSLPDTGLPPAIETSCYRVVQEALTNVTRYAQPSHVEVHVRVAGGQATVRVHDDGRGFDPEAAIRAGRSRGLVGMRERAELLGGELRIDSAPGEGATITAVIPLG